MEIISFAHGTNEIWGNLTGDIWFWHLTIVDAAIWLGFEQESCKSDLSLRTRGGELGNCLRLISYGSLLLQAQGEGRGIYLSARLANQFDILS